MRKKLIITITILLIILFVILIKTGLTVGNAKILSFEELQKSNAELDAVIEKANSASKEYQTTLKNITTDLNELSTAKKQYLELVKNSSERSILESRNIKSYKIEYIWNKVGRHATKQGVNIKMDIDEAAGNFKDLRFLATGSYLGITNFIYAIENDSDLDFIVEDFKMIKDKATFKVRSVRIVSDNDTEKQNN